MTCPTKNVKGAGLCAAVAAALVIGPMATSGRSETGPVVADGRPIFEACGSASVNVWNSFDLLKEADPAFRASLDAAHPKVLEALEASLDAAWPVELAKTRRTVERCLTLADKELDKTEDARISKRYRRVAAHAHAARRQLVRANALLQEIVPPAQDNTSTSPSTPIPAPGGSADFAWTNLSPSADSRIIYVSYTDGNDANTGLSSSVPVKTLQTGADKLRAGYPDWLLLKRGDVWPESYTQPTYNATGGIQNAFRNSIGVYVSGRSASEPIVVWSYGTSTARPQIYNGRVVTQGTGNNLSVVGLEFIRPNELNNLVPMAFYPAKGANVLLEDCMFEGYSTPLNLQPATTGLTNLKIRGNVVVDSYDTTGGHSQGILLTNTHGAVIEGNVFDLNGWRAGVAGAGATIFNHNVYIQYDSDNIVYRNNISARASSHGLQLRTGGTCEDNLFLQNPIAALFGADQGHPVGGTFANNVILDGGDIDTSNRRGWGVDFIGINNPLDVHHNVVAHNTSGTGSIRSFALGGFGTGSGFTQVTIRDNVTFNFGRGIQVVVNGVAPNAIRNNHFEVSSGYVFDSTAAFSPSQYSLSNNTWYSGSAQSTWFTVQGTLRDLSAWASFSGETGSTAGAVSYPDSSRNIATYMATLGGTQSLVGFLTEARKLSRLGTPIPQYMANRVNAYIRAGFGVSGN